MDSVLLKPVYDFFLPSALAFVVRCLPVFLCKGQGNASHSEDSPESRATNFYSKYYILTIIAYLALTVGTLDVLLFAGLAVNNTYGISAGLVM